MRRKMTKLLYWCLTVLGLTGVFVVLRGRPSETHGGGYSKNHRSSHFLSQGDLPGGQHIPEEPAQFLDPVEEPGVRWEHGQRTKLDNEILAGAELGGRDEVGQDVKPIQIPLQRNLHYAEPDLSRTNMRKLDEIRNISKTNYGKKITARITNTLLNDTAKKAARTHQYRNDGAPFIHIHSKNNNTLHPDDTVKKSRTLRLEDIFIGVKTTTHYHRSRLGTLVTTWFQQAKNQTYFFTDGDDPDWQIKTGGHMINTGCPTDHRRQSLCCKFAVMYREYMESGKKWFCHLDDDNYLNVPNLLSLLSGYAADKDYYIGRSSLNHAIETIDREDNNKNVQFWFATGGAGFCISRALALNMFPYAGGGVFQTTCNRIRLPDDVTVGFISEYLVGTKLTNDRSFNSHLQTMKLITGRELENQITLSYGLSDQRTNVIMVPDAIFTAEQDPSRFLSLHCSLFPEADLCRRGHR